MIFQMLTIAFISFRLSLRSYRCPIGLEINASATRRILVRHKKKQACMQRKLNKTNNSNHNTNRMVVELQEVAAVVVVAVQPVPSPRHKSATTMYRQGVSRKMQESVIKNKKYHILFTYFSVNLNPLSANIVHARYDADFSCSGCSDPYRQNY